MEVSRSGYYKWIKTRNILNQYEKDRILIGEYIIKWHKKKPSYGYHDLATKIREEIGIYYSDNLFHKVCKKLGIKSEAKHYKQYKRKDTKEEHKIYPNLIKGKWESNRPFEIVSSDTTTITFKGIKYDWNFYVDIFDNSIVGSNVSLFNHGCDLINHKEALLDMLKNKKKRGYKSQETIFHSDQGAIYTSASFNDVYKNNNIIRSMSRAGTPTDNPVIESKNGWLKSEIVVDFNQEDFNSIDDYINHIIYDHNYIRPSYALKYKTPVQFRTELGFK